jgi:hypothetical protein
MMKNPFLRQIREWVARWHIFKPKIPIWVNFGGSYNGRCWYISSPFGSIFGHWVYLVAIWYILWLSGILYPILVCFAEKNLATLRSNA